MDSVYVFAILKKSMSYSHAGNSIKHAKSKFVVQIPIDVIVMYLQSINKCNVWYISI